jgi:hypothetical protein
MSCFTIVTVPQTQIARVRPLNLSDLPGRDPTAPDRFCDTDRCDLQYPAGVSKAADEAPAATGMTGAAVFQPQSAAGHARGGKAEKA